ncbi:MAG: polymerase sigma factor RpoE [Polyangiaceae bacterium]|jgi:RNA polymerase sigma-70 factor (ECF subfamily)|nr:polymerase sigma factor RpoE [Polyangiaceae bacterium]
MTKPPPHTEVTAVASAGSAPLPTPRGDGPARAPSRDAFRAACEQHLDFVWRFAAYCGVPAELLEPVVHKVFGVIHGRLISLENQEELRVSVAGITRHVVRGYLRQLGDHSPLAAPPTDAGPRPLDFGGAAALNGRRACELCDLILGKMTETEREVFILCEVEGLSLSDTAEALHIGESTLRVRLDDARRIFNVGSAELRAHQFWTARQNRPDE